MKITVEIEGKAEFERAIKDMAKALPPDKVEPVFMEGAKTISNDAKSKAPQGPTGNLKRSIKSKFLKQIANNPRSAAAVVDKKIAPHCYLVEYGSLGRYAKKGKHPGRYYGPMPARPFFRPAVDAHVKQIYQTIRAKLFDMVVEKFK